MRPTAPDHMTWVLNRRGDRLAVDRRTSLHTASSAVNKQRLCLICRPNTLIERSNAALLAESHKRVAPFPTFPNILSVVPNRPLSPPLSPLHPSLPLWLAMAWCSITRISCREQGSIIKGLACETTLGCRCVPHTAS